MKHRWFLCVIVACYVSFPFATITMPFVRHRESSMTEQAKLARNFNKFGLATLKFGPLDVSGPSLENYDNWRQYYLSNRQVLPLMIFAGDFAVFGVNEWSMRLVLILVGIGSIMTFYFISRRLLPPVLGERADIFVLVAVAAYTLNTSFWYFSTVANVYSMTLLAIQGCLLCYLRWITLPTRWRFLTVAITFFIACNVGWPAYYLGVVFAVHSMFILKRGFLHSSTFLLLPICFFCVHLLHIYLLDTAGGSIISRMGGIVLERSSLAGPGFFEYITGEGREIALYFGLAVCFFSVVGVWKCLKSPGREASLILLLILVGLEEVLFARWAHNHDYFSYVLNPFFALTATVGVSLVCALFQGKFLEKCIVPLFLLLEIAQSTYFTHSRYTRVGAYRFYYELAGAMNSVTSSSDRILVLTDNLQLYTPFYSDRYTVTYSWKDKTLSAECRVLLQGNVGNQELIDVIRKNKFKMNWIVIADWEYSRLNQSFLRSLPDSLLPDFGVLRSDSEIVTCLKELTRLGVLSEKKCNGFIFFKYVK